MICSNITRGKDGALCFAGQPVTDLADRFGTPLYLMDEARIRENCRMYKNAFRKAFPEYHTQTEHTLAVHFELAEDPRKTADALAAAICHGHSADTRDSMKQLGLR